MTYPIAMISGTNTRGARPSGLETARARRRCQHLRGLDQKCRAWGRGFARLDPERDSAGLRQSRCDFFGHRRYPQWRAGGAVQRISGQRGGLALAFFAEARGIIEEGGPPSYPRQIPSKHIQASTTFLSRAPAHAFSLPGAPEPVVRIRLPPAERVCELLVPERQRWRASGACLVDDMTTT